MTTITFDSSLTPRVFAPDDRWKPNALDPLAIVRGIALTANLDTKPVVTNNLASDIFHSNYLAYLEFCWAYHYVPVLTPDTLWFTLLNEIASVIRENPEVVRELFSESKEKRTIVVPSMDPEVIPLDLIIDQLKRLVPSGADNYLPTFSTTTPASRFAHHAAFCDAVSPYYSYSMYLCGLPAIRIEGSVDDYIKVVESWRKLPKLLSSQFPTFFAHVQATLENVVIALEGARSDRPLAQENARNWFKGMFEAKNCGSGHQIELDGWIVRLHRKQPKGPRYASNFESQVAKVDYKAIDTGREFSMLYGLFSSHLVDGIAQPLFSPIVFERTKVKQTESDSVTLRDRVYSQVLQRAVIGQLS